MKFAKNTVTPSMIEDALRRTEPMVHLSKSRNLTSLVEKVYDALASYELNLACYPQGDNPPYREKSLFKPSNVQLSTSLLQAVEPSIDALWHFDVIDTSGTGVRAYQKLSLNNTAELFEYLEKRRYCFLLEGTFASELFQKTASRIVRKATSKDSTVNQGQDQGHERESLHGNHGDKPDDNAVKDAQQGTSASHAREAYSQRLNDAANFDFTDFTVEEKSSLLAKDEHTRSSNDNGYINSIDHKKGSSLNDDREAVEGKEEYKVDSAEGYFSGDYESAADFNSDVDSDAADDDLAENTNLYYEEEGYLLDEPLQSFLDLEDMPISKLAKAAHSEYEDQVILKKAAHHSFLHYLNIPKYKDILEVLAAFERKAAKSSNRLELFYFIAFLKLGVCLHFPSASKSLCKLYYDCLYEFKLLLNYVSPASHNVRALEFILDKLCEMIPEGTELGFCDRLLLEELLPQNTYLRYFNDVENNATPAASFKGIVKVKSFNDIDVHEAEVYLNRVGLNHIYEQANKDNENSVLTRVNNLYETLQSGLVKTEQDVLNLIAGNYENLNLNPEAQSEDNLFTSAEATATSPSAASSINVADPTNNSSSSDLSVDENSFSSVYPRLGMLPISFDEEEKEDDFSLKLANHNANEDVAGSDEADTEIHKQAFEFTHDDDESQLIDEEYEDGNESQPDYEDDIDEESEAADEVDNTDGSVDNNDYAADTEEDSDSDYEEEEDAEDYAYDEYDDEDEDIIENDKEDVDDSVDDEKSAEATSLQCLTDIVEAALKSAEAWAAVAQSYVSKADSDDEEEADYDYEDDDESELDESEEDYEDEDESELDESEEDYAEDESDANYEDDDESELDESDADYEDEDESDEVAAAVAADVAGAGVIADEAAALERAKTLHVDTVSMLAVQSSILHATKQAITASSSSNGNTVEAQQDQGSLNTNGNADETKQYNQANGNADETKQANGNASGKACDAKNKERTRKQKEREEEISDAEWTRRWFEKHKKPVDYPLNSHSPADVVRFNRGFGMQSLYEYFAQRKAHSEVYKQKHLTPKEEPLEHKVLNKCDDRFSAYSLIQQHSNYERHSLKVTVLSLFRIFRKSSERSLYHITIYQNLNSIYELGLLSIEFLLRYNIKFFQPFVHKYLMAYRKSGISEYVNLGLVPSSAIYDWYIAKGKMYVVRVSPIAALLTNVTYSTASPFRQTAKIGHSVKDAMRLFRQKDFPDINPKKFSLVLNRYMVDPAFITSLSVENAHPLMHGLNGGLPRTFAFERKQYMEGFSEILYYLDENRVPNKYLLNPNYRAKLPYFRRWQFVVRSSLAILKGKLLIPGEKMPYHFKRNTNEKEREIIEELVNTLGHDFWIYSDKSQFATAIFQFGGTDALEFVSEHYDAILSMVYRQKCEEAINNFSQRFMKQGNFLDLIPAIDFNEVTRDTLEKELRDNRMSDALSEDQVDSLKQSMLQFIQKTKDSDFSKALDVDEIGQSSLNDMTKANSSSNSAKGITSNSASSSSSHSTTFQHSGNAYNQSGDADYEDDDEAADDDVVSESERAEFEARRAAMERLAKTYPYKSSVVDDYDALKKKCQQSYQNYLHTHSKDESHQENVPLFKNEEQVETHANTQQATVSSSNNSNTSVASLPENTASNESCESNASNVFNESNASNETCALYNSNAVTTATSVTDATAVSNTDVSSVDNTVTTAESAKAESSIETHTTKYGVWVDISPSEAKRLQGDSYPNEALVSEPASVSESASVAESESVSSIDGNVETVAAGSRADGAGETDKPSHDDAKVAAETIETVATSTSDVTVPSDVSSAIAIAVTNAVANSAEMSQSAESVTEEASTKAQHEITDPYLREESNFSKVFSKDYSSRSDFVNPFLTTTKPLAASQGANASVDITKNAPIPHDSSSGIALILSTNRAPQSTTVTQDAATQDVVAPAEAETKAVATNKAVASAFSDTSPEDVNAGVANASNVDATADTDVGVRAGAGAGDARADASVVSDAAKDDSNSAAYTHSDAGNDEVDSGDNTAVSLDSVGDVEASSEDLADESQSDVLQAESDGDESSRKRKHGESIELYSSDVYEKLSQITGNVEVKTEDILQAQDMESAESKITKIFNTDYGERSNIVDKYLSKDENGEYAHDSLSREPSVSAAHAYQGAAEDSANDTSAGITVESVASAENNVALAFASSVVGASVEVADGAVGAESNISNLRSYDSHQEYSNEGVKVESSSLVNAASSLMGSSTFVSSAPESATEAKTDGASAEAEAGGASVEAKSDGAGAVDADDGKSMLSDAGKSAAMAYEKSKQQDNEEVPFDLDPMTPSGHTVSPHHARFGIKNIINMFIKKH